VHMRKEISIILYIYVRACVPSKLNSSCRFFKPRAWAHLGRRKIWMGSPLQSPGGWRAGKALDLIWFERWEYVYNISVQYVYILLYYIICIKMGICIIYTAIFGFHHFSSLNLVWLVVSNIF
jgi:hypothetical protein